MSEENKVDAAPADAAPAEPTAVVEISPIEQQAMDQGWMPKDAWVEAGNDPNEHRSAKEFVDRGELYRSLSQTRGELKRVQMAHTALQRHHQHVFEQAHLKAINDLKQEKRAAIRADDLEAVAAIDEEIDSLKETHERERQVIALEQKAIEQTPAMPAEWQNWRNRNNWYDVDQTLKEEADSIGLVYISRRPGTPPLQVLEHVEKEIKRRYPDRFGGKRAAPSAVQGVDRTQGRKGPQATDIELSDLERDIMRQLVSSGEMTENEYKAELKKTRIK
jgi:hypothetical protein